MTIVAWDGKTLAADKRAVSDTYKGSTTTKIFRFADGICGIAGHMEVGMHLKEWLQDGGIPDDFPELDTKETEFLVIYNSGRVAYYESTAVPLWMEERFHAIGSGKYYALASMHLGKSAKQAVEVACALDAYCGNGIDTLTIKPVRVRK
jgi:20S proteasome alpha/beta subunit